MLKASPGAVSRQALFVEMNVQAASVNTRPQLLKQVDTLGVGMSCRDSNLENPTATDGETNSPLKIRPTRARGLSPFGLL